VAGRTLQVSDGLRRVCLFGAPPDTGNLGVEALFHSVVASVAAWDPAVEISVFDNGFGHGPATLPSVGGNLTYQRIGMRRSRRLHRWESTFRYRVAARNPHSQHPGIWAMRRSRASLDISGGDSFSDIYGLDRFEAVIAPKELTLSLDRPLVLLPQTYGPFKTSAAASRARRVLAGASQIWARDEHSMQVVHELHPALAGDRRCQIGVDVAFALPVIAPSSTVPQPRIDDGPVVGINVSGLLSEPGASGRFGLRLSYRTFVIDLIDGLIDEGAQVVLVPHVGTNDTGRESDREACQTMLRSLDGSKRDRVTVATGYRTAAEAKWVISQLDWFVGTRMHSTIASLSSDVPTAALAYSDKTAGVFATCGLGDAVVDARYVDTTDAVKLVLASFAARAEVRSHLVTTMPAIRDRARRQIFDALETAVGHR
jgi:colanic acid/amylovoran biosynthesis protein